MIWDTLRMKEVSERNLQICLASYPKEGGPIGNYGIGDIEEYIDQSLVGRTALAYPLLIRGNQRIDQGLAEKEYEWFKAPPAQHRHRLHRARALGYWLEDGMLAVEHWNQSRRFLEAWWRSEKYPWTRQDIIREGLDDYMAMAVLGGEDVDYKGGFDPYRAGVDMYEHWLGEPGLSPDKVRKPRELGYVLCRHYLNSEFDRDEVLAAGRRVLAANLESHWLENGQILRAAMRLMVVHWHPSVYYGEEPPAPVDVLLMAYDDMPNVTRPF